MVGETCRTSETTMSKKPRETTATQSAPSGTPRGADVKAIPETRGGPAAIKDEVRTAFQNGRVPPHDLDAEAAVLAAIVLSRAALDLVLEILEPRHFFSEGNGYIFDAAKQLAMQGTPIDIVTVATWLRDRERLTQIGGATYLAQLADATPAVAHVVAHAQAVYEKWRRRELIAICQRASDDAYGDVSRVQELISGTKQDLYDLARTAQSGSSEPLGHALRAAFQQVTASAERGERITGMSTGFEKLDAKTAGLHPGDMMVVAARPGMGKSAFALNLGVNVASPRTVWRSGSKSPDEGTEHAVPGYGVVVISLEMSREQLVTRMVCAEARVDVAKLRCGFLQPDDWRRLTEAARYLSDLPIWIDRSYNVTEIRAKVLRLQAEYNGDASATTPERKLGLVIVDPVQLLESDPRRQNREEETADAARALKRMALDLDVAVIAVSQLSRAVETRPTRDKRPQLWDMRDSGAIEDAADAVVFIYRDEYYHPETTNSKGLAEIILSKQRNGPLGKVFTKFTAPYARFDNLVPGDYPVDTDDD